MPHPSCFSKAGCFAFARGICIGLFDVVAFRCHSEQAQPTTRRGRNPESSSPSEGALSSWRNLSSIFDRGTTLVVPPNAENLGASAAEETNL